MKKGIIFAGVFLAMVVGGAWFIFQRDMGPVPVRELRDVDHGVVARIYANDDGSERIVFGNRTGDSLPWHNQHLRFHENKIIVTGRDGNYVATFRLDDGRRITE